MDPWVWIVIAVVGVIVAGLLILSARKARERQLETQRQEAVQLRSDARATEQRAEHRAAVADELAESARREQQEARMAARRADEVDPDADT